jgi:hypothetical protein
MKRHVKHHRPRVLGVYFKLFNAKDSSSVDVKKLVIYQSMEQLKVNFGILFDLL